MRHELRTKLERFFDRIESGESYAFPLLAATIFVGFTRHSFEALFSPEVPNSFSYGLHNAAWYLAVAMTYTAVLSTLTKRKWTKTVRTVSVGSLLGILPPLIDVFIYGPGGFEYSYIFRIEFLFRNTVEGDYVGELIAVWSSIFLCGGYVYTRTESWKKGLVAIIAAYLGLLFLAAPYPAILRNVSDAEAFSATIGSFQLFGALGMLAWATLVYICLKAQELWPSLLRINHALPWFFAVLIGAAIRGTVDATTIVIAGLVLLIHMLIVITNDYYDRHGDQGHRRQSVLTANDVTFINGLIIWYIAVIGIRVPLIGLLLVLYLLF